MTRAEFREVMAYIEAGVRDGLKRESAEVYYGLLKDLPVEALRLAAKRALLEHRYPTFPTIAMLRDFATLAIRGEVQDLPWGQAWKVATRAIARCDVDVDGSVERAFRDVPPIVRAAVEAFGFMALYNLPPAQMETARAHFRDIYDQLADRQRRTGLLPSVTRDELRSIADRQATKRLPSSKTTAALPTAELPNADRMPTPSALEQLAARFSMPATEVLATPAQQAQDALAQFLARPAEEREQWLQKARVRFSGKSEDFILDAAARICRAEAAPKRPEPCLATRECGVTVLQLAQETQP